MIRTTSRSNYALKALVNLILTMFLAVVGVTGCGQAPPLSPQGQAFKKEVGNIIHQMQQSLADPVATGDVAAINEVLQGFSASTAGLCIDCPYKTAVLNREGILLTTFPDNEVVGRNFSSYRIVSVALQKERIAQSQAYLADGTKIYFISAPLIFQNKVAGVAVLALSPADLEKKWHLSEKEFLAIDFNR
jgi:C4-dicarboxylate-specific signal transduction histidine kinase